MNVKVRVRGAYSVYVRELAATLFQGRTYEVPREVYRQYGDWLQAVEETPRPQPKTNGEKQEVEDGDLRRSEH